MAFELRFFFDAGAGVCLWSQNGAARERFGYAVELDELNLPATLEAEIGQLMQDYDATIDWGDAGLSMGPTAFGYEHDAPFKARVREMLPRLRTALGPGFEVASDFED